MPHVIVDDCTKDFACLEVCPTGCISPTADDPKIAEVTQLYINPKECLDCGACVSACPSDAISLPTGYPRIRRISPTRTLAFFKK